MRLCPYATGLSNIVTAAVGAGYTGSYIFSQTIFTMRAGVRSRVAGVTVCVLEMLVFVLPFNVVQVRRVKEGCGRGRQGRVPTGHAGYGSACGVEKRIVGVNSVCGQDALPDRISVL